MKNKKTENLLNWKTLLATKSKNNIVKQEFFVFWLHCKACELLIWEILSDEKDILEFKLIKTSKSQTYKLNIVFSSEDFKNKDKTLAFIRELFKNTSYKFSYSLEEKSNFNWLYFILGTAIAIVILEAFWLLNKFWIINQMWVDANSSLLTFFIFGFLASISSCAVLVWWIILSLTKLWQEIWVSKWKAVLGFQVWRIISFSILGFVLGLAWSVFTLNLKINAILLLIVAILMLLAGLNFLWIPVLRWLPENKWAMKLRNNRKWNLLFLPILAWAITFFLPCGFTYTAQVLALSSGNPLKAFFIMLAFVLWTLPILTIIWLTGFASKTNAKKAWQEILNYIVWILIVIFSLISLNSQLSILWLPNFNFNSSSNVENITEIIPSNTENNTIVMVYWNTLSPSIIRLKVWETYKIIIDVKNTIYGCMSTIFLESLDEQIRVLNAWSKLEFNITPTKKWTYEFLCAMWVPHNAKVVVE